MKAHQRLIREQLVGAAVLDGNWPGQHGESLDIDAAEVRLITFVEARDLIEPYEKMPRLRVHDGDKTISERHARARYGTADMAALAARGLIVERVPRRGRYFAFRGSRREQKTLRAAIADRIKPYPKRPMGEPAIVIKFAGAMARLGTKNIGFVRVRRRTLKSGSSASFNLLRSVWVDGKPRHVFLMTLGSQHSDRDDGRFWPRVNERMIAHGLTAAQRQRLVDDMVKKGAHLPQ